MKLNESSFSAIYGNGLNWLESDFINQLYISITHIPNVIMQIADKINNIPIYFGFFAFGAIKNKITPIIYNIIIIQIILP